MSARLFTRRALLTLAVAAGVSGFSGCRKNGPTPVSGDMTAIVIVSNRGFYDVNVYAIRTAGVIGRRLATISGGSTGTTLRIREADQQPGGGVTLQLRAIGARSTWISPTLNLGFGVVGRLEIASTGGGDLSQTMFYSLSQQPGTL